jgi:hypothetical protein
MDYRIDFSNSPKQEIREIRAIAHQNPGIKQQLMRMMGLTITALSLIPAISNTVVTSKK